MAAIVSSDSSEPFEHSAADHATLGWTHLRYALFFFAKAVTRLSCKSCKGQQRRAEPKADAPITRAEFEEDAPTTRQGLCSIIEPSAPWKGNWDLVVMLLICYSAVVVPVQIGFNMEAIGYHAIFEIVISILFRC